MSQTIPQAAASLVSLATTEGGATTPSASTTALVPKSGQTSSATEPLPLPAKDYESAFGTLSSSYGFGGASPAKNPKKTQKTSKKGKGKAKASPSTTTTTTTTTTPPVAAQGASEDSQSGQSAPKK
ncbi:hypothetical protein BC628DRAFT_1420399 [Trametes gibbosa]|nr:hypothetical protein BC628DRAFT_1420399 [Trametes gibbosa]